MDEARYVGHPHTSGDGHHYFIPVPNCDADGLGECLLEETVMVRMYMRRQINSEEAARARYDKIWKKRTGKNRKIG